MGPLPTVSVSRDMSALTLLRLTSPVVKAVIVILIVASIVTWTVWIAKSIELARARRRLKADLTALDATEGLNGLPTLVSEAGRAMAEVLKTEVARAGDLRQYVCAEGLKERVSVRLQAVETAMARQVTAGTLVLASIGATAPFVGLFGTVWGIMNSFIGISNAQTTNLAVVAPGIAEALLTTAMGLVAAVPAVLIYNAFARSISGLRALLAEVSTAMAVVLSLDVERRQVGPTVLREAGHPAKALGS